MDILFLNKQIELVFFPLLNFHQIEAIRTESILPLLQSERNEEEKKKKHNEKRGQN